ncbi:MAG: hypothetical protein HRS57_01380 [Mycoplasmataceae bacterium]|nr:hypothetical protein [Mycoplasmataceae bacterium]
MVRVVWSEESIILSQYLNKVINNFETDDLVKLDLSLDTFDDLRGYLTSGSIFDDISKRIILCKNSDFLSNPAKLNANQKALLEKIIRIADEDDDLLLIFAANINKLSKNTFISKNFKANRITHGKTPEKKDLKKFVYKYTDKNNSNITESAVLKIIERTDYKYPFLLNELKKLVNLNVLIDEDIVDTIVTDYKPTNYYRLSELIIRREIEELDKLVDTLSKEKKSVNDFIPMMLSQFGFYFKVKYYALNFDNNLKMISDKIGGNQFRTRIVLDLLSDVSIEWIREVINLSYTFLINERKGRNLNNSYIDEIKSSF